MSFLMSLSRRSQLAERLCYGRKHGLSGYVMFDYIDRRALSMPSCCHYCLGIFGHHGHCQHLPANNSRMKQHPRVCGHAFRYPFAIQWYGTTQQQSPNQLYIINWKPQLNSECTDSVHMYLCNPMYTCIFRGRERETERQKDRQKERKRTEKKRKEKKGKEKNRKGKKGRKRDPRVQDFGIYRFQPFVCRNNIELNLDGQGIGLVDSGGGKQLGISYTSPTERTSTHLEYDQYS